ncbi:calmodulin binding protein PICBP-like [Lotus japonicus]|nr:calmodulin binding protein PICBP-like [Lotus japonicus]
MVQRKVTSKLGIQAEHVKSDKLLGNLKLYSSHQHQEGKARGADMKKKMKKSRPNSIKLSDLEALQTSTSPPSRRSLSQPGKPPTPLHVPKIAASASTSPQKLQPLVRTTDASGSPNYMKPTSSSHAKKELFLVSHRKTQTGSDFKNLKRKLCSDSKDTCVSSKKTAKTLTRSSSLKLVRTLTKTTSFKAYRSCPRKSTRAAMCADMSADAAHRATCSSTLKDSKFPAYLMLSPGGTESEGTSAMKVCPYTYCSLNGHHLADLPPLKSFMSARRHVLKTQKRMKLEALSPRRLKVSSEKGKKEESDIEQNVFDAKPAADEIGMDVFIEIYAKEKDENSRGEEEMGRIDYLKEIEDQEDVNSTIQDMNIMQFTTTPSLTETPSPPEFKIDLEEDMKTIFDDAAVEVDVKGGFPQEKNLEEADEDHEEISMGSYCSDEEHMGGFDMGDSDSKSDSMEWDKQIFCGFDHEEDADSDSSVSTEEDLDSEDESSSESSHDMSVTWLDDILSNYYEVILFDETLKQAKSEESSYYESQPHHGADSTLEDTDGSTEAQETCSPSSDMGYDQSPLTEEILKYLKNAEENAGQCNNKHVEGEAEIDHSQAQKVNETCEINETSKENNNDDYSSNSEENQLDVPEESIIVVQDQNKANKFKRKTCINAEDQNTSDNGRALIRRKKHIDDDDDEMRKFNPRDPNFLPLVPEPGAEKVDLRHQMMDERKNAEEWMLDCALRQVVDKLAPARKKKVALLVEAFEAVMPNPKCDTRLRNSSGFAHGGRIQACS